MDGLAKGGSLPARWLSAADSGGKGVRRAGRQSGHCYLAGRSKLSPLISAVMSEENTSHQRIFIQQRVEERSEAQEKRRVHLWSWSQSATTWGKTIMSWLIIIIMSGISHDSLNFLRIFPDVTWQRLGDTLAQPSCCGFDYNCVCVCVCAESACSSYANLPCHCFCGHAP